MTAYLEKISQYFRGTPSFLTDTLEKVANSGQNIAEQIEAINKVNPVTTQGVIQISDAAVEKLQAALISIYQDWLKSHPILAWLLTHPLASLVIFMVTILLLWGLLKSIVKMTEQVWLTIFKSPFKLGEWLVVNMSNSWVSYYRKSSRNWKQERLAHILNRLEEVKKEEAELLKEIKTLM